MTIIYFILILGVTVFVHELGHFIFAKRAGIYVYEFALGMGPRLLKFNRKNDETIYSIRLFPIGGFVQMAGEGNDDDHDIPNDKKLPNKTWKQRFITLSAGILFNFILAIVLFFIIALFNGSPKMQPYIAEVEAGSNAAISGLEVGDMIVEVNNKAVYTIDHLLLEITSIKGDEVSFTVKKVNGETKTVAITKVDEEYGFLLDGSKTKGLWTSFKYAFLKTGAVLHQMVLVIAYLVTGKISTDALAGPVGIYSIINDASKLGFLNIMYINAIISINVGFINLLPIPAFDGGHLLFLIIEKIKGKPVNQKVENVIHTIGFALLMILMLFITYKDIIRLFK